MGRFVDILQGAIDAVATEHAREADRLYVDAHAPDPAVHVPARRRTSDLVRLATVAHSRAAMVVNAMHATNPIAARQLAIAIVGVGQLAEEHAVVMIAALRAAGDEDAAREVEAALRIDEN